MFRQIVRSAIHSGRLKFVETPRDDQAIPIGPDGKKILHRLLQADPFKDKKVKAAGDGIKLSSAKIIHEHNDDILEGNGSIKVTVKTSSTGGQHESPKIDACKIKESKGQGKHKNKKPKVTFAQLLEKYQKMSEEKSAYRPTNAKASRSPPRRKSEDRYWQSENYNATYSYPYFGPPMSMPWIPPYANFYPYSSWGRYDSSAHSPSYFRPSHQNYAAPRRYTSDEKEHNKDRFNHKESVRSSKNKREVVKQVYRVKKDGRTCASSDLVTNKKEPVEMVKLATKGKEVEQANVQNKDAKSGQKKSEEKNAYLSNHAKKPRSPLGCKSPRR